MSISHKIDQSLDEIIKNKKKTTLNSKRRSSKRAGTKNLDIKLSPTLKFDQSLDEIIKNSKMATNNSGNTTKRGSNKTQKHKNGTKEKSRKFETGKIKFQSGRVTKPKIGMKKNYQKRSKKVSKPQSTLADLGKEMKKVSESKEKGNKKIYLKPKHTRRNKIKKSSKFHDKKNKNSFIKNYSEFAKLNVSNLDLRVSVEDMTELFSEFGKLKKVFCQKPKAGQFKKASIFFLNQKDAIRAMKKYNEMHLDGRPMKITLTKPKVFENKPKSIFGNKKNKSKPNGGKNTKKLEKSQTSFEDLDKEMDDYMKSQMIKTKLQP